MEKKICQIEVEGDKGAGFFCKIPFPDKNKMLKVLVTNNHIIYEKILEKKDEKITIHIKEEKEKLFNLNNRIKYTNSDYDTTIIEIKEEDGINNYLELDDNILNDIIDNNNNRIEEYKDIAIYLLQYYKGESTVSYGNIIQSDEYEIINNCYTNIGGSPILELNNKVIGIHCSLNKFLLRIGTFINYPIKEFIQRKYYKNNINKEISAKKIMRKINYQSKKSLWENSTLFKNI